MTEQQQQQQQHIPILQAKNLSVFYGEIQAVKNVSFYMEENRITAIIGPSGCGKSTMLRTFNRMNDFIPNMSIQGQVEFYSESIFESDPIELRTRIGMVFQRANPFPKSIYDNISWGPKIHSFKGDFDELVETSLRKAALWDEVKDRLHSMATSLSGGQQQRLCIARAIAMKPEVILMDEPCSSLDPKSISRIENLMTELRREYTIIIVTHNMQQASRISDNTAFFYEGELIEFDNTGKLFTNPQKKQTEDYITGRFG